ncbi:receptor-like serine/threonine-protein kinase At4g25390 [Beta vulgaris subsp. vulgaris]|uniref:receptor-like serine/threonine-protein kinase At4g25390 n=1 Tax=Beta vulgaris subsp. vulgaris TaxID=3555 RepID=UPI0020375876|nr:receptor-like serine/threonine-protein kinase At4g25390 [Beta vulgaris subsp. vulgaris]
MSSPPYPQPNFLSPPQHHHHHHHITPSHLLPPLLGAILTFSLLLLSVSFFRRFFHRLKPTSSSLSSSSNLPRRFSFSHLRRITSNFSPSRRLGQGGFGSVFSGSLSLSRNREVAVAVKLLDSGSLQGEREFQNELLIANKLVESDRVVKLLGFASSRRRRRMCLVYELMVNGNLQDCLLHKKCEELMEWSHRFRVAVEVAQGLAFLHHHCDPPIIHGDVKPSNILLDDCFRAKIADFGLARIKLGETNDAVVVNIGENQGITGNLNCNSNDHHTNNNDNNSGNKNDNACNGSNNNNVDVGVEDTGSVMETESVTTTVGFEEGSVGVDLSPMRIETSPEMVTAKTSPSEFYDKGLDLEAQFNRMDMESVEKEMGKARNGNVNGGGTGKVKDYVMEWMGMEVAREGSHNDWVKGGASSSSVVPKKGGKTKGKTLEWWVSMEEGWSSKKEKRRPVRAWWKEEYSEELARKKKKKKKKKRRDQESKSDNEDNWWPRDDEMYVEKKNKYNRSRKSSRSSIDWWLDGFSGDLWKVRHTSYDSMSGEIPKSGGISSTPSMRGTVCYIAPEYSSGGDLSEKCDVYSFGVLLLVLIAGRRPLQVTGSPMSEFYKANLVSWARQLARSGKLHDLVDKKIRSLNREEAQLCIIVALMCLQKAPARRPSMKEVVGMLTGEFATPQLPMEYSKSPASQYPYKSRKKNFR